MIKNIVFDIGGVLVDFHPIKTLMDMGLSQEQAEELNQKAFAPIWDELDRGVMNREDVFAQMIKNTPVNMKKTAEQFLTNEIFKTVTSRQYSADWLKNLKKNGYKIYLLTNYPDFMFEYHWKNTFTFSDSVDGKIVSGIEKVMKPDHRIYERLLEEYGLVPSESLFIDDREENVTAAQQTGISAIRFTAFEEVNSLMQKKFKISVF